MAANLWNLAPSHYKRSNDEQREVLRNLMRWDVTISDFHRKGEDPGLRWHSVENAINSQYNTWRQRSIYHLPFPRSDAPFCLHFDMVGLMQISFGKCGRFYGNLRDRSLWLPGRRD